MLLLPLPLGGAGRLSLDALLARWLPAAPALRVERMAWTRAGLSLGLPRALLRPARGRGLVVIGALLAAFGAPGFRREISPAAR
jgi:putative oxidoreductase